MRNLIGWTSLLLSYLIVTKSTYVTAEFIIFIGFLFLIYFIFEALSDVILENYFKYIDTSYNFIAVLLYLNKWANTLLAKNMERITYNIISFDTNYFLYLMKELLTNYLVRPKLFSSLLKMKNLYIHFITVKYFLDKQISSLIVKQLFTNQNYYYLFFLLQNITKKQLKK